MLQNPLLSKEIIIIIIITVVITNICITIPGHWDNYDYFLIVITDFWLLYSHTGP